MRRRRRRRYVCEHRCMADFRNEESRPKPIDAPSGAVLVVEALAFATFVAWAVAAVFTFQTYRDSTFEGGFLDPLV